jgi:hypothetical protein
MQQGRTAGQGFRPTRFIDFYKSPYPKQVLVAKEIARAEKGTTVQELMTATGAGEGTIRTTINNMRRIKAVYVSGWKQTGENSSGVAAVYSVGNLPDAEKPMSKRALRAAGRPVPPPPPPDPTHDSYMSEYYKELAGALVPKRNEQEQREVNWKYLCHINPGVVKYFSATT